LVHAGPPAASEKIGPLIDSMNVSYRGLLVDGHDIHDGSVIPVRIHEAAGQPHSRITCERVIRLNVELVVTERQRITPPPLLILVPAEGEPVAELVVSARIDSRTGDAAVRAASELQRHAFHLLR